MSKQEIINRMQAALRNILDISQDEFSLHQARLGLGVECKSNEVESHE